MAHRTNVQSGEHVLITGASGGVGSEAVQLAKCRGAKVTAIASTTKMNAVTGLGADHVIKRGVDIVDTIGRESVNVVIDLVAGHDWPQFIDVFRRGGRYAAAGAIAGPIVEFDVRSLYLRDLSFFGCTFQDDVVFENLVRHIESGNFRPVISKTYPLKEIANPQQVFLKKEMFGKIILIPPKED